MWEIEEWIELPGPSSEGFPPTKLNRRWRGYPSRGMAEFFAMLLRWLHPRRHYVVHPDSSI